MLCLNVSASCTAEANAAVPICLQHFIPLQRHFHFLACSSIRIHLCCHTCRSHEIFFRMGRKLSACLASAESCAVFLFYFVSYKSTQVRYLPKRVWLYEKPLKHLPANPCFWRLWGRLAIGFLRAWLRMAEISAALLKNTPLLWRPLFSPPLLRRSNRFLLRAGCCAYIP